MVITPPKKQKKRVMIGIWSLPKPMKRVTEGWRLFSLHYADTYTIYTILMAVSVSSNSGKALLPKNHNWWLISRPKARLGASNQQVWQTRLGKESSFSIGGPAAPILASNRNRLDSFSNSNAKFVEIWQLQPECWRSNLLNHAPVA